MDNTIIKSEKYYVYVYLNPTKPGQFTYGDYTFDFEPFYIGKGKGYRYVSHLSEAKSKKKYNKKLSHFHNTLFSIDLNPIIKILHYDLSEEESWTYEKLLISIIGRRDENKGLLTNKTNGGEGQSNRTAWNKGLTKYTDERIMAYTNKIDPNVRMNNLKKAQKKALEYFKNMSQDEKNKISERVTNYAKIHGAKFKGCKHKESDKLIMKEKWLESHKTLFKQYKLLKDGKLITIDGITCFCKQNNLVISMMYRVINGVQKEYKGYSLYQEKN